MKLTRRTALAGLGLGMGFAGAATRARAGGTIKATWNGWPDSQVKPLFDAFNKAHPETAASYELIPFSDLFQTLEVRLGARTAEPDVYSCDSPLSASYGVRKQAMLLNDVLDRGQFSKSCVDAASFRGNMYSAPFSTSSQLLFYNRALFKQAGIEPPETDIARRWTWEQVAEAGRKITDPARNRWGLVIEQAERPYQLLPLGQSLGGTALSDDGLKATGYIDGPAFVEGFTFMQRLYTDWKIAQPGVFDPNVTPDVFGSGRAGMFLGGTFNLGLFRDKYKDLDWGVAPHPYFAKGKPVTPTGSWHIGVNPRTNDKAGVAAFIRFMTSTEPQLEWFKLRPYVPVRLDVWDKLPEVFDTPIWRIIRNEVQTTAVARPSTPGWREYEDLLRQCLRDMQSGGDVKSMLTDTAGKIDRQLLKYRNV